MRFLVAICAALVAALTSPVYAGTLTLTSPDIKPNAQIGQRFVLKAFGCHGGNVTPRMRWTGVPPATKSLVLSTFDPDAESTVGFVHWLVVRIPPASTSTSTMPGAVEALTDFGMPGYGGPCPPSGDPPHHYIFTLWALDSVFPFDAHTTYALFRFATRGHVLETARLIGRYGR